MAIQPNSYRGFRVTRGDATGAQLAILVPDTYRALHFASAADEATDWNVSTPTHPTFYFHSETTPATDFFSISHDGTTVTLNPAGATNVAMSGATFDLTVASLAAADIGMPVYVTVSAPNNQSGMAAYFDVTINGTTAGHCYGLGSWINTGATSPVLAASHIIVPFEGGVYTGEAQANARIVFGGQYQAILTGAPTSLHAWRLNVAAAAGSITALIAAANAGSVGYASGQTASVASGTIALADVVGTGVVYVQCYTTSS